MGNDADSATQLVYWLILMTLMGFIGIAVVLALMSSWRNYNRRQRILERSRKLRLAFRGKQAHAPPADIWHESGRRYRDPDTDGTGGDGDDSIDSDPKDPSSGP